MLYSGKEQANASGHNPGVNNELGPVKVSTGAKVGYYVLLILTLGLAYFWVIKKKNYLNKLQIKINESASNIDVQLQKRFDTLTKLVDAVKGHVKFNKEVYENISALRSGVANKNMDITKKSEIIDGVSRDINISLEAYPNLGADNSIQKLMNETTMIEREISASRRLYNSAVTEFNQIIFTFPSSVIAAKLNYHGLPLFAVSEEHKQDVKLTF